MTSVERTAYPRFRRFLAPQELHVFYTPSLDEVQWARDLVRSDEHLLALVVLAKCFGRLGYFPELAEVPVAVVDHIRQGLGVAADTTASHTSSRTAKLHRDLVRRRSGVVLDPAGAR